MFCKAFLAAVFFCASSVLQAELLLQPSIQSNPERLQRLNSALEILGKHEPDSPVLRWSYPQADSRYDGDLWICLEELDESTLGQWNGAEIILSTETMDYSSVQELALILHHEAAHADHHYRDLESILINDYTSFFSPRQYLLFEMLNEAFAVYKETALRYRMGLNPEPDHKYKTRPSIARYNEDFYAFFKDLRRWMKGNPGYARISGKEFEQALFREYVTGFLSDPWYLDYYMPRREQRYAILRGKDFAVCPLVCSAEFARFTEKEATIAALDRYIKKNSPPGMILGLDAGELEILLEKALDAFDKNLDGGDGPYDRASLSNLDAFRQSQKNYEELPERFRKLPPGIELRYNFSFSPETVNAFHRLLDSLGAP